MNKTIVAQIGEKAAEVNHKLSGLSDGEHQICISCMLGKWTLKAYKNYEENRVLIVAHTPEELLSYLIAFCDGLEFAGLE